MHWNHKVSGDIIPPFNVLQPKLNLAALATFSSY